MRKTHYNPAQNDDEEEDDIYDGPSRSQRKRDSEAMQKLGQELLRLPTEQLAKVPLPENIALAIADYKRMRSFGAQRRQLQLIGRYMRQLSAAAVREAIDRATGESRAAVAALHRTEKLRTAMLENDEAVTGFINDNPEFDVQKLRQLVRNARKEAQSGKPPKSARELYQLLFKNMLPEIDQEALLAKDEDEKEADDL